jgi:hypothetical protein
MRTLNWLSNSLFLTAFLLRGCKNMVQYFTVHQTMLHSKWNIIPCSPMKVDRRLWRTYRLLQTQRVSQARNQQETGSKQILPLRLFFHPEDGGDMFLQNVGLAFTALHYIISQKIEVFVTIVWERQIQQLMLFTLNVFRFWDPHTCRRCDM